MNNNCLKRPGTTRVPFATPVKTHPGSSWKGPRQLPGGLRRVQMSAMLKSSFAFCSYFLPGEERRSRIQRSPGRPSGQKLRVRQTHVGTLMFAAAEICVFVCLRVDGLRWDRPSRSGSKLLSQSERCGRSFLAACVLDGPGFHSVRLKRRKVTSSRCHHVCRLVSELMSIELNCLLPQSRRPPRLLPSSEVCFP